MVALDDALLQTFPPVSMAMAYGSTVFQQKNHDSSSSMMDLVFAVDDPEKWHAMNLEQNTEHYSFVKWFGAKGITVLQVCYYML